MKIIAKHKDYYDCMVNTLGMDPDIVFMRHNDTKEIHHPGHIGYRTLADDGVATTHIIGFAGKLYPAMCVTRTIVKKFLHYPYSESTVVKNWIYDIDEMRLVVANGKLKKSKWKFENQNDGQIIVDRAITLTKDSEIEKIFHDKQVGSFIIWGDNNRRSGYELTAEPILADIQFFKCLSAFDAFLEMQRFISEQLRPMMEEVQLTDKQKVVSKGFDPKYGFRKRK